MTPEPGKGYQALRDGRHSQDGSVYFVTFCSAQRLVGLTKDSVGSVILAEIQEMDAEAVWTLRCAVIMPDHVHLLFRLGGKLSLGKAIARLKSKSSATLSAGGLRWQTGYFEHHMRPKEDPLPVFIYVWLCVCIFVLVRVFIYLDICIYAYILRTIAGNCLHTALVTLVSLNSSFSIE